MLSSNCVAATHNITHSPCTSTCTTHPVLPNPLPSTTLLCTQLTQDKMAQDLGMVWKCCGIVPILFGWFLRVSSPHALVFVQKTFLWLWYYTLMVTAEVGLCCCQSFMCTRGTSSQSLTEALKGFFQPLRVWLQDQGISPPSWLYWAIPSLYIQLQWLIPNVTFYYGYLVFWWYIEGFLYLAP